MIRISVTITVGSDGFLSNGMRHTYEAGILFGRLMEPTTAQGATQLISDN